MALTKIDDRGLKTPIDLLDNEKIRLGTGNDLEIYHQGNTYIDNTNDSCDLRIQSDTIELKASSADEMLLKGVKDGAVELYHNNSKKLETISTGVKVQSSAAHCHLKINSANSNSSVIHFGTAADDDMAQIWYDDYSDALYYRTSTNTPQIFYTNNAERMRIDSSGRLLLGTTTEGHSNADDLTVASSADTGITIRSGNSSQSSLYFSDGTSGTDEYMGSVVYNHSNNQLYLATSGSNRLAIDSSGNVGIGEATPLAQLHIKPATNKSQLLLEQNNAVDGYALFQDGPNGGHLKFMRHVNGTETQKLLLRNDGGLCFGTDTAAANALDDYEEGTFTPQLAGFSSISYHRQDGFYTKIGRQVWMHVYLYVYQATGNSNKIRITNLPFTSSSANSGYIRHGGTLWYQNDTFKSSFNSESKPHIYIDQGSTEARFVSQAGSELNGEDTYLGSGANNRYIICGLQMIV